VTRRGGRARAPAAARPTGRTWVAITVEASGRVAEAVSAILQELRTGGLVEERPAPDRCRFRCYLPPSRLLGATLRGIRARVRGLRAFGLEPGRVTVAHRAIAARRWGTAWRSHVRPVRVGRLFVRPTWARAAAPPRSLAIEIDPGMAFGTGLHPSTRLCLRALLRAVPAPGGCAPVVFDIGTGSGILAIAAARLGARRVLAVDEDPVAVAVARENVRRNGVGSRVRVVCGDGLERASGRAHVVVANIVADVIIPLLPDARAHLEPGGVCIGSGLVADRVGDVLRAARAVRLHHLRTLAEGEWRAVVLQARGPAPGG